MGGFGSGRRFGKACTDDMHAMDVRKLQRQRLLKPGHSLTWSWSVNGETCATINLQVGTDRVTLNYRTRERGGGWRPMRYPILLDWTGCNYGGKRAWWLCPAADCGRRVAVIYAGDVFACRQCHHLAYRCQRETDDYRATRRADTIRQRLGWEPGILNGAGWKPKGMHWRTFERLENRHDAHVSAALAGMAARLGLVRGRSDAKRDQQASRDLNEA